MVYRSNQQYRDQQFAKVEKDNAAHGRSPAASQLALRTKRLELDIADLLTGPTAAATARDIAFRLTNVDPRSVAIALREAGDAFLTLEEIGRKALLEEEAMADTVRCPSTKTQLL